MTSIPFFGQAVHALFPYLQTLQTPEARRNFPNDLEPLFRHILTAHARSIPPELVEHWHYTTQPKARILSIWNFLLDLIAKFDDVILEPPMREHNYNARTRTASTPDFLLIRGKNLVIFEVKTWIDSTDNAIAEMTFQIQAAAKALRRDYGSDMELSGCGLLFHNHEGLKAEATWMTIAV